MQDGALAFGSLRCTVEFDPGSVPVSGRLLAPGQPERTFAGWLDLMQLLQDAASPEPPASE